MTTNASVALPPRGAQRSGTPQPNAAGIWAIGLLCLAVYAVIFAYWQVEPVPAYVHAAGVLLAAVCLFPIVYWRVRGSQGIPMFEMIVIAYWAAYGLPLYLQPNQIRIRSQVYGFRWEDTFNVLLWLSAAIGAMILAYYLVRRIALGRNALRIDLPLHPRRRGMFIYGAIIVGSVATFLNYLQLFSAAMGEIASLIGVVTGLSRIGLVLLAYYVYNGKRYGVQSSRYPTLLLYGATGALVALGLMSGMLEEAIIPVCCVFAVRWHVMRKLPLLLIIGAICVFVVLNTIKRDYRQQAWYGGKAPGLAQRLQLWADLAQDLVSDTMDGNAVTGADVAVRKTVERIDLLHTTQHVVGLTPEVVPYYGGKTYEFLVFGWIPRMIWPDKPTAQAANVTFALDYGLLLQRQVETTMMGIGHLGEAYANFGVLGMVLVMGLQGVIFALLDGVLNGPRSEGGRAIYLAAMIYFLNGLGSATASTFGFAIISIVGSVVILRIFASGFRAKQPGGSFEMGDQHGLASPPRAFVASMGPALDNGASNGR